jgi:hypothetical protein
MADRLMVKKTNITDATGAVCMDGVSGDSQTVISIIICETAGADETFDVLHTAAGGSSGVYIYKTQSLPANSTFEHTAKIVVDDTDEIWVKAGGSADIDVIVSYLQQDDA